MLKSICMHVSHSSENYLYSLGETERRTLAETRGKKIQIPIVKGYNPVYRRFEICDEGFFKNS